MLSANNAGALRNSDDVGKAFVGDSAEDRCWLMGAQPDADTVPLKLQIDGEEFVVPVFVATCPARVEPVNGVPQNGKVRVTTDKAWPRREGGLVRSAADGGAGQALVAHEGLSVSCVQAGARLAVPSVGTTVPDELVHRASASPAQRTRASSDRARS